MKESAIEWGELQKDPKSPKYISYLSVDPIGFWSKYNHRNELVLAISQGIIDKVIDILVKDKKFMNKLLSNVKKELSEKLTDEVAMTMFRRTIKEKK